jgi:trehalose 6-phosphate phosphatase
LGCIEAYDNRDFVSRLSIFPFPELMELPVPFDPDDLDRLAILFDVDGTLLDIAPSPREVQVSSGLVRTLELVSERAGGAAAVPS